MSNKPIFVATHPRACSTAFERVFMTRRDTLQTVHEPFGDAYYFGPERLAERYENDPKAREESGYAESTYRTIFDRIQKDNSEVRFSLFLDSLLPSSSLHQPYPFMFPTPNSLSLSFTSALALATYLTLYRGFTTSAMNGTTRISAAVASLLGTSSRS
ncbi:hypothetical protein DM02DRAFT_142241 [Periconia macrospinosa]|uniref:Uncharacterized protein n=1 Tax=Periconia macrospinosa TaxID=97972 RepID=A0A2V1E2I0_9PLEO|nr:hypothetical protein DM02DRAFT_142241 [Periconia macrospinosa]